jgi:hypothetical protein
MGGPQSHTCAAIGRKRSKDCILDASSPAGACV